MAKFRPEFIDRVRQAVPIETVVGQRVQLKKAGKNLKGLCPFHNEKTPSFTVEPTKGFYHCFGCHKGGSVFQFVMEFEGVSFGEAVELLAQQAGIPLELEGIQAGAIEIAAQRREHKQRLMQLCRSAQQYFEKQLHATDAGRAAQEYLLNRGVTDAAARAFRLGYSPDQWDALTAAMRSEGYSDDELVRTGLALKGDDGASLYDRFRNRLMFPIWDLTGEVIAFGGRVMGEGDPKYLNSPETPIYVKSKVLYPINLTKRAIQQKGVAILCEGYMDAIALAQHRFTHVVASCGTALTDEQAHLIKRFATKVVMAYDGDSAGQEATQRSVGVLLEQGIDVFVAPLSGGEDPDSFLRKHGAEAFAPLVENAEPFFPYLLRALKAKIDLRTPHGQRQLCQEVFPLIARFDSSLLRGGYLDELARFLGLDSGLVSREFGEHLRRDATRDTARRPVVQGDALPQRPSPAEETLLSVVLKDEHALRHSLENLDSTYLTHPAVRAIVERAYELFREDQWRGQEMFLNELADDQASLVTDIICRQPDVGDHWKMALDDCIALLHNQSYEREIARLQRELNDTPDTARQAEIVRDIQLFQKNRQVRVKRMTFAPAA